MCHAETIYLDNNASAPPLTEVVETVAVLMREGFGNPSSAHRRGAEARKHLAASRESVATFLGAGSPQIFFTSGGTEGNNTVLSGVLEHGEHRRLITTAVEHDSILSPAEALAGAGVHVDYLPVDEDGRVACGRLEEVLGAGPPALLSVQWANSETGVVQPIADIVMITHKHGSLLHVDAAQAVGRLRIDLDVLPIDFLTFSSHKIHGPPGSGALYAREPRSVYPLLLGGGQEHGVRSGTENLPGIAGLALACSIRGENLQDAVERMQFLRDSFEAQVLDRVEDVTVNGGRALRVCNTSNLRIGSVDGQALLAHLDRVGILCSQTSACSSHRPEASHVLLAMGLSEDEAFSSLRFSFSVLNTPNDVERAVVAIREAVQRLRRVLSV